MICRIFDHNCVVTVLDGMVCFLRAWIDPDLFFCHKNTCIWKVSARECFDSLGITICLDSHRLLWQPVSWPIFLYNTNEIYESIYCMTKLTCRLLSYDNKPYILIEISSADQLGFHFVFQTFCYAWLVFVLTVDFY